MSAVVGSVCTQIGMSLAVSVERRVIIAGAATAVEQLVLQPIHTAYLLKPADCHTSDDPLRIGARSLAPAPLLLFIDEASQYDDDVQAWLLHRFLRTAESEFRVVQRLFCYERSEEHGSGKRLSYSDLLIVDNRIWCTSR